MSANTPDDTLAVIMAGAANARRQQHFVLELAQRSQEAAAHAAIQASRITPNTAALNLRSEPPLVLTTASLLLQTVVERRERTSDGHVIAAVMVPWFALFSQVRRDPNFMHQISPEKLEELIAGAYDLAKYSVILTPRSGDRGRDVIATSRDGLSVRVLDQAKKLKPGTLVDYDAIRAFLFVIDADHATKGFLTTTSDFPPKLMEDPLIAPRIGSKLELVNGASLAGRLEELAGKGASEDKHLNFAARRSKARIGELPDK